MKKTDFEQAIVAKGFTKAESKLISNAVIDIITETLQKGEKVSLTGFGTFSVADVPERTTNGFGKKRTIPAHKKVRFTSGAVLKKAVNK